MAILTTIYIHFRYWLLVFFLAAKRLFNGRYTYRASALAFTTLLALVPLFSASIFLLTILPIFTKVINMTRSYILANFIPTAGTLVEKYIESFAQQATHLPKISLLFLFFTAVMMVITVKRTLNDIWPTQEKKQVLGWFLYWLVLILAPFFIGLSVLLSSYLSSLHLVVNKPLLAIIPWLVNVVLFSALYIAVLSYRSYWQDGIFGGILAATLFEVAKAGFAFYVRYFISYQLIYGALAIIPLFLIWLYISWLIVLYGALITRTHFQQRLASSSGNRDVHGS